MGHKLGEAIGMPWVSNSEKTNKLQFASNACKQQWESECASRKLPKVTTEAVLWAFGKSDKEISSFREQVVARIIYITTDSRINTNIVHSFLSDS